LFLYDYYVNLENNHAYLYRFTKTWKLRNNGDMAWPEGCYLKHTFGEKWGDLNERIPLPIIAPGQEIAINIELVSPARNDIYYSNWRACTANGSFFGGDKNYNGLIF